MCVLGMVKPTRRAESSAHFLRILYPFTQAHGPKADDSALGTLMSKDQTKSITDQSVKIRLN